MSAYDDFESKRGRPVGAAAPSDDEKLNAALRQMADAICAQNRDRLFRTVLPYMARHDIDIAALLQRQDKVAEQRAQIAKILEAMSK